MISQYIKLIMVWWWLPQSACVCARAHVRARMHALSPVWLFATLWTVAWQAPLSMEFSRQEYWSELRFPPPGDLPHPGIEPEISCISGIGRQILSHCTTWKPSPNPHIPLKYSRISTVVSYQDLEGIFGFIQICLEPTDDLNWFLVFFFCWYSVNTTAAATAAKSLQSCPSLQPHGRQPTRLPCPWDSPGKNTAVGCHFLLQ